MFFGLWWTFDDHLATALNAPGLGELPLWVVLLIQLAILPFSISYNRNK